MDRLGALVKGFEVVTLSHLPLALPEDAIFEIREYTLCQSVNLLAFLPLGPCEVIFIIYNYCLRVLLL